MGRMPKWIAGYVVLQGAPVALPLAGQPPAPNFGRLRWIREVHDHELVVILVVCLEIRMDAERCA
jgi:hypothetical protein